VTFSLSNPLTWRCSYFLVTSKRAVDLRSYGFSSTNSMTISCLCNNFDHKLYRFSVLKSGPVRFAEKTSQNIVLADLVWEKKYYSGWKNKLKITDYKRNKQSQYMKQPIIAGYMAILKILDRRIYFFANGGMDPNSFTHMNPFCVVLFGLHFFFISAS